MSTLRPAGSLGRQPLSAVRSLATLVGLAVLVTALAMSASGSTSEVHGTLYLIRLLAYLLILFAIVLKNRER